MNSVAFQFEPFSLKQAKLYLWWREASRVSDCDGVIADGAIRSGKTIVMSLSFVTWAMETFNNQNFIVSGKTVGSCRRNVLEPLKQMLTTLGYGFMDRRTDNLLIVRFNGRENKFYIFGGRDESSQNLIQGITAAGAFFDEVALMPQSFVNQATARCSVDGSKWFFNCNPESPYHWFKTDWIDKAEEKNLLYMHFTMDDNPSLTEKIKERYRRQWTGLFYDRFIRGLWAVAEGIVYDMFNPARHVVDRLPGIATDSVISCDYGTQNPMVFLLWKRYGMRWICVREYYYSGRDHHKQKTDAQYADDLVDFIGSDHPKRIIIDPSAASFKAEVRRHGFKVEDAINDVSEGIRATSVALQDQRIQFHVCCVNTIQEFGTYAWDMKKSIHSGVDVPLKEHDHAMDATRYFVSTVLTKKQTRLNRTVGGSL